MARIHEIGALTWVRGVGVVLFVFILTRVELRAVVVTLYTLELTLFTSAVLFLLPLTLIKAVRWGLFLSPTFRISVGDRTGLTLIGSYFGAVTLGKLGDFVRVLYLRDRGCSVGTSIYSIMAEKLCDLSATVLVGTLGLILLMGYAVELEVVAGVWFAAGATMIAAIGLGHHGVKRRFVEWMAWAVPRSLREAAMEEARKFGAQVQHLSARKALVAALLTGLFWILSFIRYDLLLMSLHADVPLVYTAMIVSVVQLVVLVPVSFLGLGTRDLTLLYLFGMLGLPDGLAISFSLLFLVMTLINAFCGYVVFLSYGRAHTE